MSKTYSREDYEKIKASTPSIEEAGVNMVRAAEACLEIAKESGAPEYIKTAEAMRSALDKIAKAVEEASESTHRVEDNYE